MRKISRTTVLALLWVMAAACGYAMRPVILRHSLRLWQREPTPAGTPSRAIFPTQTIPLHFSHQAHMALPQITCERCHSNSTRSDQASDSLVPTESACTPCHAIDRSDPNKVATPGASCATCHATFDPSHPERIERVQIPPANIRFSHQRHANANVRCVDCHARVQSQQLATRFDLPSMRDCIGCHQRTGASQACTSCHLTEADGVMRTEFAEGILNPPPWMLGLHHDADFWVNHRQSAAIDGARCLNCHRERECVECHDGRVRDRRVHPNDYLSFHGTEARMAPNRCASCHRAQSFCETCHQRQGVAMTSPPAARGLGRFHPAFEQWSGPTVTMNHHAMEARRSMGACVSCHSERDCVSCHATTGLGGAGLNPHPPAFATQCGALLRASGRACAQCHQDLNALSTRCR